MSEHPKLHEENTIIVQKHEQFGRIDYAPCNALASQYAAGFKKKGFSLDDLKFLKSMGYIVLVEQVEAITHLELGEDT